MHARRYDDDTVPYGWPLQAAPFEGPRVSPDIADVNNLTPFTIDYPYAPEVDIALYAIDNMGLIADVDVHRALSEEERQLIHRRNEVNSELATLRSRLRPVRTRLTKAHAYPRVHPYLNHQARVPKPNHQWPGDLRQHELTMDEALGLSRQGDVNWMPRPWYHDDIHPGANYSPVRFIDCVYCNIPGHNLRDCPNPHRFCAQRLSCIIPSYHRRFGPHCPSDKRRRVLDEILGDLYDATRLDTEITGTSNSDGEC